MRFALLLTLGCLVMGFARAEDADEPNTRAINKTAVAQWHAQCASNHADDTTIMLRPGVLADRKTKRVEFFAEATGIKANETVEFFLIAENSGNDYEALAIGLAEPVDIYDAMLFIGMPLGRGMNPQKLQFWPKGERVFMTLDGHRIESFIVDSETKRSLDPLGLVFIGSQLVPAESGDAPPTLAAQTRSPHAIAANYNESDALFDVPYSAPQTAVYSKQTLNPEQIFPKGKRIRVVIEPEYKHDKRRIRDLSLHIARGTNATPSLINAQLALQESGPSAKQITYVLPQMLAHLSAMTDDGYDPFVTVQIGDAVTIGQLNELALLLKAIDSEKGIRVEPPTPGQLYYKAFAPNPAYRSREDRFLQPWELRLRRGPDGVVSGIATEITEIWTQGEAKPAIETETHNTPSPESLCKLLTSRKPDVKVLLVYAPATLTHAELMSFVSSVQKTHPFVHVYIEPKP